MSQKILETLLKGWAGEPTDPIGAKYRLPDKEVSAQEIFDFLKSHGIDTASYEAEFNDIPNKIRAIAESYAEFMRG